MNWKKSMGNPAKISDARNEIGAFFSETLRRHLADLTQVLPHGIQIAFCLTGEGGGEWVLEHGETVTMRTGRSAWSDCRIECSVESFMGLIQGKCSSRAAFLAGDIQVQGDVGLLIALEKALSSNNPRTPEAV